MVQRRDNVPRSLLSLPPHRPAGTACRCTGRQDHVVDPCCVDVPSSADRDCMVKSPCSPPMVTLSKKFGVGGPRCRCGRLKSGKRRLLLGYKALPWTYPGTSRARSRDDMSGSDRQRTRASDALGYLIAKELGCGLSWEKKGGGVGHPLVPLSSDLDRIWQEFNRPTRVLG